MRGDVPACPPHEYTVRGSWDEAIESSVSKLEEHGCVVWDGCLSADALLEARSGLAPVMAACRDNFDAPSDSLKLRFRDFGITRTPRVEAGKKNVHFDPHGSACFRAMDDLAAAGRFAELVGRYLGQPCSLTESGLSVTRPGGLGMEWHADGAEGEATVLLTLDDVEPQKGCLGLVPGSHAAYNPAKGGGGCSCRGGDDRVGDGTAERGEMGIEEGAARGDEEADAATDGDRAEAAGRAVWYPYRAGMPCIIDARTLHCAADNGSEGFRFVLWYIYNIDCS